jgi:choline-sulfatase
MKAKKNFLVIIVDQLPMRALNFYGGYFKSDYIDEILENSTTFESCTTACPLCQPSRASFWSGRYPHKTKVLSNGRKWKVDPYTEDYKTLGELFRENGYDTLHFGKRHDGGTLRGFTLYEENKVEISDDNQDFPYNFDTYEDRSTTNQLVSYLTNIDGEDNDKPKLIVADFVNPHNICGYVGAHEGLHEDVKYNGILPKLPENFSFDDIENRSKSIQYICCSHNRQAQVSEWSEDNFRHYLAAYNFYLNVADKMIGEVLEAYKKTKLNKNTIVCFMSDHGDALTSRGSVTKQVAMYRETVEVPFAFMGDNIRPTTIKSMVSLLDLFPTLLDFADIQIPEYADGKSLKSNIIEGQKIDREYVVSQWHTEWGFTVSPSRMLRTKNYCYIHYLEDDFEEFYDLLNDPYEKKNVIKEEKYLNEINRHRSLFENYLRETDDNYRNLNVDVDKMWRSHKVGYSNHRGLTAPLYDSSKKR